MAGYRIAGRWGGNGAGGVGTGISHDNVLISLDSESRRIWRVAWPSHEDKKPLRLKNSSLLEENLSGRRRELFASRQACYGGLDRGPRGPIKPGPRDRRAYVPHQSLSAPPLILPSLPGPQRPIVRHLANLNRIARVVRVTLSARFSLISTL